MIETTYEYEVKGENVADEKVGGDSCLHWPKEGTNMVGDTKDQIIYDILSKVIFGVVD